jgi:hypothetical protein
MLFLCFLLGTSLQRSSILKYQKLILISLLLATNFYNLIGQTRPIFQKIDQSQGLSSSRITGIIKEKNGFIWIST